MLSRFLKLAVVGLAAFGASYAAVRLWNTSEHNSRPTLPASNDRAPASPAPASQHGPTLAASATVDMVWIPGGEFTMGTNETNSLANERPAHRVKLDGFWIDEHDVTNAEFRKFVKATGYVTTAEKPVDWEELKKQVPPGTPKPPDEKLRPGSLAYTPPDHPVDLRDM